MEYATGRCMCHGQLRNSYEEDYVVAMVRKVFRGRVAFHDGADEIAPGITVHHIGGHAKGLQSVRVKTRRGNVVLASDCTHFYAHMDEGADFPDDLQSRRGAGRLRDAEAARDFARRTSCRATIRWCSSNIRPRRPGWKTGWCGSMSSRKADYHSIAWTSSSRGFAAMREEPIVSTNGSAAKQSQVSSRKVLS